MLPLHSMGEELRCEQPPVRQALQAFDREFAGAKFLLSLRLSRQPQGGANN